MVKAKYIYIDTANPLCIMVEIKYNDLPNFCNINP